MQFQELKKDVYANSAAESILFSVCPRDVCSWSILLARYPTNCSMLVGISQNWQCCMVRLGTEINWLNFEVKKSNVKVCTSTPNTVKNHFENFKHHSFEGHLSGEGIQLDASPSSSVRQVMVHSMTCLKPRHSTLSLRSTSRHQLIVPRHRRTTFGWPVARFLLPARHSLELATGLFVCVIRRL